MFDHIVTSDGPAALRRKSLGVVASFVIHGLLIGGMFGVSYLMARPQEEATKVTFFNPPPPPPPPPPGGGGKKQQTKPKTPKVTPVKKNQLIQPKEIPKEKPKEEEKAAEEDKPEVVGGVEGGVEGGVVGGVVGGSIGGVLGGSLGGTGAPGTYERVSKAPGRISGSKEPPIPPSVLTMVRGSKGIILAKIKINSRGKVDAVEIVRSTIPVLDDIVRKFIMGTWEFEPPLNAGRPVAVEFLQPFQFVF